MPGACAAVEAYLPGSVLPSDEPQQRYRLMFERSPVGQVGLDAHGCVLLANAAFCHLVGVDSREFHDPDADPLAAPFEWADR